MTYDYLEWVNDVFFLVFFPPPVTSKKRPLETFSYSLCKCIFVINLSGYTADEDFHYQSCVRVGLLLFVIRPGGS